jgi:pyruvate dehydrogenase E1 component alpha subunit
MPRNPIHQPDPIEYLSILDEEGCIDKDLEPNLPDDLLQRLFRAMLLGRRFDERAIRLQRQGRIGTFAPASGQEAAHLGAVAVLQPSDWMIPSFRETAAEFWRGRSLESFLLYFGGMAEGARIEADRRDLPIAVPVGSQILHAVGIAWGIQYHQRSEVAMTFFGDGATSEGDFHEGLNMAGVFQLPVVFICQNNQWAISIPRTQQTRSQTLAQKALAYGMPGLQVDGNDILAVYSAAQEAVARARNGGGPTLIECVTYRLTMHTTADDPKKYRTQEEVAQWQQRDPLPRFQQYLEAKGLLTPAKVREMEASVEAEIQSAVDNAEQKLKAPTDPMLMFDHIYETLPGRLHAQKALLARELERSGE